MASRRKQNVPQKRTKIVPTIDEVLEEIRKNSSKSMYPRFQQFKSELRAYYVFDSAEDIQELASLFGDRENKLGTKNREWFGNEICNWKLYYKNDIDNYKKEIIELINIGSKLMNIGLEVKPSEIPGAGYGLFATKSFEKGNFITRYGGYYCNVNFFVTHGEPDEKTDYVFQFPKELGFGILNCETVFKLGFEMGRWPNSDQKRENLIENFEIPQNGPPMLIFNARRNIEAGEELYWWYGKAYTFSNSCVVCSDASQTMCEICEIPICGLSCHDKHIERKH